MRILISGLGVAGPALAYWLLRHGFEVTLVEIAPAMRRGGYIVDFWGTGYDVAERMGLAPTLRERGYQVGDWRLVDANGKRVGGFKTSVFERATKGRMTSLPRGELAAAIAETIEGKAEILFGETIVSLEDRGGHVHVTFAHGPARDFDLVIGADGLHSNVRRLVFGPEDQFESFLGYKVAAFETLGYRPRDELVYVGYNVPGKQAARFSMREDKTLFLFVFVEQDAALPEGIDAQKRALHALYDHAGWECPAIMNAMDGCDTLYFDRVSQIRMAQWSKGRIALVGDAAACPSLMAGEGSALAMTAAYVLAGELKTANGDHAAAFARYEIMLRRFIAGKQDEAKKFAATFAPKTRFGIAVRNLVTSAFAFAPLADAVVAPSLRDDFTLPDYSDAP